MFSYFEWKPFFVGLVLGLILIVVFRPTKDIIYKYPHPKTIEKLVYRDPSSACYTYSVKEVDCDANESTLKEYPLQ